MLSTYFSFALAGKVRSKGVGTGGCFGSSSEIGFEGQADAG